MSYNLVCKILFQGDFFCFRSWKVKNKFFLFFYSLGFRIVQFKMDKILEYLFIQLVSLIVEVFGFFIIVFVKVLVFIYQISMCGEFGGRRGVFILLIWFVVDLYCFQNWQQQQFFDCGGFLFKIVVLWFQRGQVFEWKIIEEMVVIIVILFIGVG